MGTPSPRAEASENILFYGNSFTLGSGSTRSVPAVVESIALAAGRPPPNLVNAAVGGKDFAFHLDRNFAIINGGLPALEQWDFVVMQNFSTAPTRLGDLTQHRSDSVRLYQAVANHSPQVTPVLFETWARAPGHDFYEPPAPDFPGGPAQMQQEVRNGYLLAAMDIDTAAGSGTARIAPVGDAWESLDWMVGPDPLHANDLWHAANPGTLLAALTIYATIFQDDTTDIDLSSVLTDLVLPGNYGPILSTVADQTVFGVPEPSTAVLLFFACVMVLASCQRADRVAAFRQRTIFPSGNRDVTRACSETVYRLKVAGFARIQPLFIGILANSATTDSEHALSSDVYARVRECSSH